MCEMKQWGLPGETHEQTVARKIAEIDAFGRYEYDLIGAASSIHHGITGASEPDCRGINSAWVRCIRRRLGEWREPSCPYDLAVKALCESTLAEYEGSWLQKWEAEP